MHQLESKVPQQSFTGDGEPHHTLTPSEIDWILEQGSFSQVDLGKSSLPPNLAPADIGTLSLKVRTQNGLARMRCLHLISDVHDLHLVSLGQMLRVKAFGVVSLLDLIAALRPYFAWESNTIAVLHRSSKVVHETCRALTEGEIDAILTRNSLDQIDVTKTCLPPILRSIDIDALPLKVRTRNGLARMRRLENISEVHDLHALPLVKILRVGGFGVWSMLDLIAALRPYFVWEKPASTDTHASEELRKQVAKLLSASSLRGIRCDDPRLGSFVSQIVSLEPSASLTDPALHIEKRLSLIQTRYSNQIAQQAIARIKELRASVARLRRKKLESELFDVVRTVVNNDRSARMICRFYGFDGQGSTTLQETGDEYALTRERVRQIADKIRLLVKRRPFLPALDAALKFVAAQIPTPANQLERAIKERRISAGPFRLEGLRNAADLFNRRIQFNLETVRGIRMAVPVRDTRVVQKTVRMADKLVSKAGVCSILTLAEKTGISTTVLQQCLAPANGLEWLDAEHMWFSMLTRRNHLNTVLAKIAAVSARTHVKEIRGALSRDARLPWIPPTQVLRDLLISKGWTDELDFFAAHERPSPSDVLSDAEFTLYDVLLKNGPVLYRTEFQELCASRGLNRTTFSIYAWRCPIVSRVAPALYSLIGAEIEPGITQDCLSKHKVITDKECDFGWTSRIRPWLSHRVTPSMMSGVFQVPAAIRQFVKGTYAVVDQIGDRVGKICISDNNAWGLNSVFRARYVEPGDYVVLEFDSRTREANVVTGGPELPESFASGQENLFLERISSPAEETDTKRFKRET